MIEGTYLDAVLDKSYYPHFNGTREETITWLRSDGIDLTKYRVCIGETLETITAGEYLRRFEKKADDSYLELKEYFEGEIQRGISDGTETV